MSIALRYPGRICLLGEHCDWAGGASLVVPLPMGIDLRCEPGHGDLTVVAELEGELLEGRWPTSGVGWERAGTLAFVPAAAAALARRGIAPRSAHLRISGDLPAGRGFSSSAASCLAVLDGLARNSGAVLSPETLAELAYVVEHDMLGVACGRLDPVACALAQPVWIRWFPRRHGGFEPAVRPLQAGARFHLVAGCFSRPRDTALILSTLQLAAQGDLRDAVQAEQVRRVHTAVQDFAAAASDGARALVAGDPWGLGRALDAAQQAYEDQLADGFAALRAPALWRTCQLLREHGALGAKFTGAGGDGSVIALYAEAEDALAAVDLLERNGLRAWSTPFGEASP